MILFFFFLVYTTYPHTFAMEWVLEKWAGEGDWSRKSRGGFCKTWDVQEGESPKLFGNGNQRGWIVTSFNIFSRGARFLISSQRGGGIVTCVFLSFLSLPQPLLYPFYLFVFGFSPPIPRNFSFSCFKFQTSLFLSPVLFMISPTA